MKRYFFIIIYLLFSNLFAQSSSGIEEFFTKQTLHWEEISYNSSLLIPKYFKEGKSDSLRIVFNYWKDKHGITEPIMRFRILYAIYNDLYSSELFQEEIIEYLLTYQDLMEIEGFGKDNDWTITYFNSATGENVFPCLSKEFNLFTMALSSHLMLQTDEKTSAYLFCEFYRNNFNSFYNKLKSPDYAHTETQKYYHKFIQNTLNMIEGNFGLYLSYWYPTGKNKILGNHLGMGFVLGTKKNRILGDLVIGFRFSNAPQPYYVMDGNDEVETKYFFGGYIGLETGYELKKTNQFCFNALWGIAYDGFDAVKEKYKVNGISIYKFNLNFGVGMKYFVKKYSTKYIGCQLRYNIVDYNDKGGSDLSGNTITIRMTFGIGGNQKKNHLLKSLQF